MSGVALGPAASRAVPSSISPRVAQRVLPNVTYWPSTPWGGDLPFRVRTGTAHYFGVGAYVVRSHDARLAGRALHDGVSRLLPSAGAGIAGGDSTREPGRAVSARAGRHVFRAMVGHAGTSRTSAITTSRTSSASMRHDCARTTPSAISRSGVQRAQSSSNARCRSFVGAQSPCAGALTWLWADPWSGAGWGCVDVVGRPKSAWYGMRRASRPVAIALTNEGLDGVDLHAWNDTSHAVGGTLHVRLLRDGRDVAFAASVPLEVAAHGAATHSIDGLLGRFTDVSHAYRFGAPGHDVVHAVWMSDHALAAADSDTAHSRFGGVPIIDEAALLVYGDQRPMSNTGLEAHIVGIDDAGVVDLSLSAASLAQHVRIGSAGHVASDSYFTLLPGTERRVRLVPHGDATHRADRRAGVERSAYTARACARVGGCGRLLRRSRRAGRNGRARCRMSVATPISRVTRHTLRPRWIRSGDDWCIAHWHPAEGTVLRRVAILCPSIGSERSRGERVFRVLADRLAARGVSTLRLDYPGTANSTGDGVDASEDGSRPRRAVVRVDRRRRGVCDAARPRRGGRARGTTTRCAVGDGSESLGDARGDEVRVVGSTGVGAQRRARAAAARVGTLRSTICGGARA